jgi:hypothetical protein
MCHAAFELCLPLQHRHRGQAVAKLLLQTANKVQDTMPIATV